MRTIAILSPWVLACLALSTAALWPAASPRPAPPPLRVYVATLLIEDRSGVFQLSSFVDAQSGPESVAGHVAEFVAGRYPGGKVLSMRIEPIADEIIDRVCATRRRPAI